MSYLELKAQATPNYMAGDVDKIMRDLLMTHPRNQVPLVLQQAGVPLSVWSETYDEVEHWYYLQIEYASSLFKDRKTSLPFLFPCLLPCMFPSMISKGRNMGQKVQDLEVILARLAQEQGSIYRQYGIQVTVAKELRSRGVGSDRHMRNESCGLRFDVLGGPAMATPPAQIVGGGYGHHTYNGMGVQAGIGMGTNAGNGNIAHTGGANMGVATIFWPLTINNVHNIIS